MSCGEILLGQGKETRCTTHANGGLEMRHVRIISEIQQDGKELVNEERRGRKDALDRVVQTHRIKGSRKHSSRIGHPRTIHNDEISPCF